MVPLPLRENNLEGKALLRDLCSGRAALTVQLSALGSAGLHKASVSQGKTSYLSLLLFFREDFSEHQVIS